MTRTATRLLLSLLLALTFACAKTDDELPPPPPVGEAGVTNIVLIASSLQLPSASREVDKVSITAYARDELNRGVSGVPFSFNVSNDGFWEPVSELITDSNGTVQILLSTPTNKANRDITVTATADGVSNSIIIAVTGTTLTISGPSSVMVDTPVDFTLTLRDSAGNGISGARLVPPDQRLFIESAVNNPISIVNNTTNTSGQATFRLFAENWTADNNDTVTVSGFGTAAQRTFSITTDTLLFITPDPAVETEVNLGVQQSLIVEWREGGNPKVGGNVCFYTNRGNFVGDTDSTSGSTDANGRATVAIESLTNAGPAIVTARAGCTEDGLGAQVALLFVATNPTKLTLQATPSVIGAGGQSTLVAVLRDADNNPVKNQTVNFSAIVDTTGGGVSPGTVITDRYGRAETTYTAGEAGSTGQKEVTIRANVTGTGLSEDVTITVGGQPLYISIFYADTLEVLDTMRYRLPTGVMVTDSGGQGVSGIQVSLALWPTHFHKGYYVWGGSQWQQIITADNCPNEDIARDGDILNLINDDYNNNGELDPGGAVAALSTAQVTTDVNGFAKFEINYPKENAWWVRMEVTATTVVSQTESTRRSYLTLPILAADISNENQTPAGYRSPFGTTFDPLTDSCFIPK